MLTDKQVIRICRAHDVPMVYHHGGRLMLLDRLINANTHEDASEWINRPATLDELKAWLGY